MTVGGGPGYGSDYDDLVDQLIDCDPDDTPARLALQFQMAASLLERNYTLTDRDLRRLLAIDLADPACETAGPRSTRSCSAAPQNLQPMAPLHPDRQRDHPGLALGGRHRRGRDARLPSGGPCPHRAGSRAFRSGPRMPPARPCSEPPATTPRNEGRLE